LSTASAVPETHHLDEDDAKETLRRVGWRGLIVDSFTRNIKADGTSHVRALAHAMVLTGLPALIMIIGIASSFDLTTFRSVLEHTMQTLAPGPSGQLVTEAFKQGSQSGPSAWIIGLIATLVAGTFAFAQIERGCNRIYGIQRDRSSKKKFARALMLTITSGILFGLAFVALAAGGAVSEGLGRETGWSDATATIVSIARWPVGLLLTFAALTLVYKFSPNRHQPGAAWLQTGTLVATILWVVLTAALALYYSTNDQLSTTYGPLLGVIALLTWAYATGFALFYGMAFAAQLEAIRAGVPGPRTLRRFNEMVRDPEDTEHLDTPVPTVLAEGLTGPRRLSPDREIRIADGDQERAGARGRR
jgi:YihY family inner membrane protein